MRRDRRALRRYLGEFLWDRRVVEVPRPVWWLVLNLVILNTRPRRSAKAYEKIWTKEGSPLLVMSQRQRAVLQELLPQKPHLLMKPSMCRKRHREASLPRMGV